MGRMADREGIAVPRRVQLLEGDVDRMEDTLHQIKDELRKGRESNNRRLTGILVSIILLLVAALAARIPAVFG